MTYYDFFDFIHTLPPTTLPLREFYSAAYHDLYGRAIAPSRRLSLLQMMPLRGSPHTDSLPQG